ncbi:MAG: Fe3+-siderophore ABC transporter permease [Flavobacteriales bacterium]|nr:Fe3+-siderophore ABC transporter permease [Flavobacteriales bacterium]
MTQRVKITYISLLVLLPICIIAGTSFGAFKIEFEQCANILLNLFGADNYSDFTNPQHNVLLYIRLPRVCLSMMIGAALAVSGAGLQGLFRNPLADPGLIGISAGAMLAASIAIIMGLQFTSGFLGYYSISFATFLGAILTTIIVFKLSKSNKSTNIATMLLAGIAINALAGAVTGFIIYLSDDDQLRDITFWSLGSLGGADWEKVIALIPLIILPIIMIARLAKKLDVYALGESEALCLGVNVNSLKRRLVVWVTISVGACVAIAGMIGFIGLLIPHITRLLVGPKHRNLIWISAILGALVLSISDLLCRLIVAPAELPIGILTAILGTPLFLALLIQQKRKING